MTVNPGLDNYLLTINDVAAIFGVVPSTVRHWIRDGKIIATKVNEKWRIEESEVHRLANAWHGSPDTDGRSEDSMG